VPLATKFGRRHVPEPPSSLARLHLHAGGELHAVSHPPRIPVLDQEDLIAQGIDTATLVPGAARVDALGSCVANATTAALSTVLTAGEMKDLGLGQDPVADEKFAIKLYHQLTMSTGDPADEWPPVDCGSSGQAAVQLLEQNGVIASDKIAHGATNIVSLMQAGGLIVGQPWFNAWMTPDADGFIDGDGSEDALQAAIDSGVAGGHETFWFGVERLAIDTAGQVNAAATTIRFRNSWSAAWGQEGTALVHLSTHVALGQYCDFRQLVTGTPTGGM
jgi:hypothetical protein